MSSIALAKQTGRNSVTVYDEKGTFKYAKTGTLLGFTASTVSIQDNMGRVAVYDEKGTWKFSK